MFLKTTSQKIRDRKITERRESQSQTDQVMMFDDETPGGDITQRIVLPSTKRRDPNRIADETPFDNDEYNNDPPTIKGKNMALGKMFSD